MRNILGVFKAHANEGVIRFQRIRVFVERAHRCRGLDATTLFLTMRVQVVFQRHVRMDITEFRHLAQVIMFTTELRHRAFFHLHRRLFAHARGRHTHQTRFCTTERATFVRAFRAFLITRLTLVRHAGQIIMIMLQRIMQANSRTMATANTRIFIMVSGTNFQVFFRYESQTRESAIQVSTIRALFLGMHMTILLLIFISPYTTNPRLGSIVNVQQRFIIIQPNLFPLQIAFERVSVLALNSTDLTTCTRNQIMRRPRQSQG